MAKSGRKIRIRQLSGMSAVPVAGARTDNLAIAAQSIDVTDKDDAGWRTLLAEAGSRTITADVEGVLTTDALLTVSVGAGSSLLADHSVEIENIGLIAGDFFLSNVALTGQMADAVTFNGQTVYGDYSTAAIYQANHAITRGSASTSTFKQSFDGGFTWNTARTGVVGGAGSAVRIKHLRLGQAKEDGRVLEIAISNAVMEAGTGNPMTVRPPLLHAWPARTVAHGIHIDVTKGSSLTNKPMGIKQISVDVDGDAA
jgi:predicted secreted protein